MATLSNLINKYDANAFIFADAGNGCAYGEAGQVVDYDDAAADRYGDIELSKLDDPMISDDGTEYNYASDWIEADWNGEFRPANPYRYRLMF